MTEKQRDGEAYIRDGWFYERHSQDSPGITTGLEIEEILVHERSKFQEILMFKSTTYGQVLVLDGIMQKAEKDECSYQEMLTFLPLFAHKKPKQIMIMGGGDGGISRELVKHPDVERIVVCELDEMVVKVCREHMPSLSCGLDHPKVEVRIQDGWDYIREHKNEFDVIITEAWDTVAHSAPSAEVFSKENFVLLKESLRPDGILARQGTVFWDDGKFLEAIYQYSKTLFPKVAYGTTSTPCYIGGVTGIFLCSLDDSWDVREPRRVLTDADGERMGLRYYNSQLHRAAFYLPTFVKKLFANPKAAAQKPLEK